MKCHQCKHQGEPQLVSRGPLSYMGCPECGGAMTDTCDSDGIKRIGQREIELLNRELMVARSLLRQLEITVNGHLRLMIDNYFDASASRIEAGRNELHADTDVCTHPSSKWERKYVCKCGSVIDPKPHTADQSEPALADPVEPST